MICLDTNYLILGLVEGSKESEALLRWTRDGETLVTPALAWYEFLSGPVTSVQVDTMRAFLADVVPFDDVQANVAAQLFNAVGRKRALRLDATLAATAIVLHAKFATNNENDFASFATMSDLRLL